jgi:hypothetical protein
VWPLKKSEETDSRTHAAVTGSELQGSSHVLNHLQAQAAALLAVSSIETKKKCGGGRRWQPTAAAYRFIHHRHAVQRAQRL